MTADEIVDRYHKDRAALDTRLEVDMQKAGMKKVWVGDKWGGWWGWIPADLNPTKEELEWNEVDAFPCPTR